MAASVDQIESALLAPWEDGTWTGTDPSLICFDNNAFLPPVDGYTPWMEVTASAGTQSAIDVGLGAYVGNPTVTVSAHVGEGYSKATARQLLDLATAMYRGKLFTAGDATLHAYSFSPPVQTPAASGWYRLSQQISFKNY